MNQLNYSNQNLQNRDFKGQNLASANFSGSDLRGCNFTGAMLIEASFEGAKTGQSRRQTTLYIVVALVLPVIFVALSVTIWQHFDALLPDRLPSELAFLLKALPILALLLGHLFRDWITRRFPQVAAFLGMTAVMTLLIVMITFTAGLVLVSFSQILDGAIVSGILLLLIAGAFAIIIWRIRKWTIEALGSCLGTSFRKANLTNANFSHAMIQNTDFSQAVLTGACLFDWTVQPPIHLNHVYCEYLHCTPIHDNRYPTEGSFQPGELEQFIFHHYVP